MPTESLRLQHSRKLRILLIAELCHPHWTSVPLLGYSLARALSQRDDLDITLVSQIRSREALESDPIAQNVVLHFIDSEFVARPLHRLSKMLRRGNQLSWTTAIAASWPGYIVFERMVHRRFGGDLRAHSFDLIHRINPVTLALGSPLAKLSNVPMVIGPLNGGLPWPAGYPELRKQEREWLSPVRGMYRWLPYYRSTYRHAHGVIAGGLHMASQIPTWFRGRRYYLPENAVDLERIALRSGWNPPLPGNRFRFVTLGRVVPLKGMDLIIEAMAQSPTLRRDAELEVIGDGPCRAALETQVSEYGLSSNVTFAGWVDHIKLQDYLHRAHAFVLPSLREFGGGVVLEAMASGLPPLVVNYGGPGELVTDECGIRLPMAPREQLVSRLSKSMELLVRDPDRCQRMSLAGVDRVRRNFTWPQKAAQIVTIYRDLLGLPHDELKSISLDGQLAAISCPMESDEWHAASRRSRSSEVTAAP
jgi:glycosyltransferase involved in cell wall biosynthesis